MRLQDAKNEILERISSKLGYRITENSLSPNVRQAITLLANIWRKVIYMKQLELGQKTNAERIRIYCYIIGAGGIALATLISIVNMAAGVTTFIITFVVFYYLYRKHKESLNEIAANIREIAMLEESIASKIDELSQRILKEQKLRWIKKALPAEQLISKPLRVLEIRCPNCGAKLPIPSAPFIRCPYCGTTLSVQEIGLQIKSLIESV